MFKGWSQKFTTPKSGSRGPKICPPSFSVILALNESNWPKNQFQQTNLTGIHSAPHCWHNASVLIQYDLFTSIWNPIVAIRFSQDSKTTSLYWINPSMILLLLTFFAHKHYVNIRCAYKRNPFLFCNHLWIPVTDLAEPKNFALPGENSAQEKHAIWINTVTPLWVIFWNTNKRHPIASPWWLGMECNFGVHSLIYIPHLSMLCYT